MSGNAPGVSEAPSRFASLPDLRAEHIELMRAIRSGQAGADERIPDVRAFVERVQAAGKWLGSPDERDVAQNIITYWASHLVTAGDRDALSAGLPALEPFDPTLAPDLSGAPCPFQGLDAYGEGDAERFSGREQATKALLEKVAAQPVTLVVGPMGSGKTSLVVAGVLPQLRSAAAVEGRRPVFLYVIAGTDPFGALLNAVHGERASEATSARSATWTEDLKKSLEASPERLPALLGEQFPNRPVFIVVDNYDVLFTQSVAPETKGTFTKALLAVCPDAASPNRAIFILDERYRPQVLELDVMKPFTPGAIYAVTPLTPAEVVRTIDNAAATVGLKFDGGIVDDLAADVAGDIGALPALQFTLRKLWEQRQGDRIPWDAYRKVGRPREALQRTADSIFETLSAGEQEAARRLFLQLIYPTIDGAFVRRRLRRDAITQFDAEASVAAVRDRFVGAGLIRYTRGATPDDDYFEVAHEALANGWPRLRDWLQEERKVSRTKWDLIATARRWRESGDDAGYLLTGGALDDAVKYAEASSDLNLKALVVASQEAVRRRQKRRRARRRVVAVVGVILLLLAFLGWERARRLDDLKKLEAANYKALLARKGTAEAIGIAKNTLEAIKGTVGVVTSQIDNGEISVASGRLIMKPAYDFLQANPILKLPALNAEKESLLHSIQDVNHRLEMKLHDYNMKTGNKAEALSYAITAEDRAKQRLEEDPNSIPLQTALYEAAIRKGNVLAHSDRNSALQEYRLALQMAESAAKREVPPNAKLQMNVAIAFTKIGDIGVLKNDRNLALKAYKSSLDIAIKLKNSDPKNAYFRKSVADAQVRIADISSTARDWDKALSQYESALDLREGLVRDFRNNNDYKSNLRKIYDEIGDIYLGRYLERRSRGDLDLASKQYRSALEIAETQENTDQTNTDWKSALAHEYFSQGRVLTAQQDLDAALKKYIEAQKRLRALVVDHRDNVGWTDRLAQVSEKMAEIHKQQKKFDLALQENGEALEMRHRLKERLPDDAYRQKQLADDQKFAKDLKSLQSQ